METSRAPHRGTAVLVLGILSLVISCFPLGIVAWIMASEDLRAMDEGRMDPSGRDMTQAGKVCGIVSVALVAAGFLVLLAVGCIGGLGSAIAGF